MDPRIGGNVAHSLIQCRTSAIVIYNNHPAVAIEDRRVVACLREILRDPLQLGRLECSYLPVNVTTDYPAPRSVRI